MVKTVLIFALASLAISATFAKSIVRPLPPYKPVNFTETLGAHSPIVDGIFDIKYTAEQLNEGVARSGVIGEQYRWRKGFIVHPDPRFSASEYEVMNAALYELSQYLCIEVLVWPQNSYPTGDYVEIMRGGSNTGCWSYVGRLGGRQELNLQYNGCVYKDVVIHECIHAIGFNHEQCRPDRDDYVNVYYNNIIPSTSYNFDKLMNTDTFQTRYDIHSIMHYGSYDFSANGQATILAKDGSEVGSQGYVTSSDIAKLQRMYGC